MSLIPEFQLGLWNAWIFILFFLSLLFVFKILDHLRGKKRSSRPDKPPFNEKEEKLYGISQLAIWASNIYSVFLPLKLNTAWLYAGLSTFLFGMVFTFLAGKSLDATPTDRPATKGLYCISRNPILLGLLLDINRYRYSLCILALSVTDSDMDSPFILIAPEDLILKILDAGRWAPSASNIQPWSFIVLRDREVKRRVAEVATYGSFLADAPLGIVVVIDPQVSHRSGGVEDGAIATQNMLLAAHALGLGTCWIGSYNSIYEEEVKEILGIPKNKRVLSIVSVGFPAESPTSTRKELTEIVFSDKHGSQFH